MKSLLIKLLKKRGIGSVDQLSADEKKDFDRWEQILSRSSLNIEDVQKFCEAQLKNIEGQWKDFSNSNQKNDRLIIAHTIYRTLLDIMLSPQVEREALEKYLNQLIQ